MGEPFYINIADIAKVDVDDYYAKFPAIGASEETE